jgi:prefoldin subunit 5
MHDQIQLGYQAAIVSMKSPTYGRIGLSAKQHAGNTVSCTQAEALVIEAERRAGCRPLRRTDLLEKRIADMALQRVKLEEDVVQARERLKERQAALKDVQQQVRDANTKLQELETDYHQRQIPERPHSKLAKARKQLDVYQRRQVRYQLKVDRAEKWLCQRQERLNAYQAEIDRLQTRLERFQQDNAQNMNPITAVFRLDGGFGTAANIALLIELGYEVYTKPYGNWLSGVLRERAENNDSWEQVGKNAEMVAWPQVQLDDCPYPLDLACQRFWTGKRHLYSVLLHFGDDDVVTHLPKCFHDYNARQTIEAGNKELRQVFEVHHLKVRSAPALQLQEHFALFAANFVRFASHWLAAQCPQIPDGWQNSSQPKVKQQVKVGAHTSAWVSWIGQDCLLRFTDLSVFAGRSFHIRRSWAFQPVLPFLKSYFFSSI